MQREALVGVNCARFWLVRQLRGTECFEQYDKRGAGFEVPHAHRFRKHVAEKVSVI